MAEYGPIDFNLDAFFQIARGVEQECKKFNQTYKVHNDKIIFRSVTLVLHCLKKQPIRAGAHPLRANMAFAVLMALHIHPSYFNSDAYQPNHPRLEKVMNTIPMQFDAANEPIVRKEISALVSDLIGLHGQDRGPTFFH